MSGEIVKRLGQDSDEGLRITAVEHTWRAPHPVSQTIAQGELHLRLANGETKSIEVRPLPTRYFLRSGMYGVYRAWYHGDHKGRYYQEHDIWDVSDHEFMQRIGTFSDHVVECRLDGEVGYGIIEYGVSAGYPRYQEVQHLPPF